MDRFTDGANSHQFTESLFRLKGLPPERFPVTSPSLFASPRSLFTALAFGEAVTWTLLLSALAIRATVGIPPIALTIVGGLHGAVFLGYGVTAALVGVNNRWPIGRTILGIVLAIVPYATIPFEIRTARSGLLDGEWRRRASDDPRDAHWFDRLFRWFLNRPVLFGLVLSATIVAIFATLLLIGPPGGWPASED
jgi:integral membrane protein